MFDAVRRAASATSDDGRSAADGTSTRMRWAGGVVSAVPALFLLVDGAGMVMQIESAVEGIVRVGYPESTVVGIGAVLLVSTVLYAIPRTAVLGAILLTGHLGGATAIQVLVDSPWVLFPVLLGVLIWGGLYLRCDRLRSLLPLERGPGA